MSRGPEFYRRKAGRRDANHAAIRDGLRALGHLVLDLAGVGDGIPDLCVYRRTTYDCDEQQLSQRAVWLEVKAGKGKLRDSQKALHAVAPRFGMFVETVRTLDEALAVLR